MKPSFLLVFQCSNNKRFDGQEASWTVLQEVGVLSYSS